VRTAQRRENRLQGSVAKQLRGRESAKRGGGKKLERDQVKREAPPVVKNGLLHAGENKNREQARGGEEKKKDSAKRGILGWLWQ